MALSYNPRRRLPLLKTPRHWFEKPELLNSTDSNISLINQNWLTKPCATNNCGLRQDDFPPLEPNTLQNRTLSAQRIYTGPNQQSRINNFNSFAHNNNSRSNRRNNLQFGDFLV